MTTAVAPDEVTMATTRLTAEAIGAPGGGCLRRLVIDPLAEPAAAGSTNRIGARAAALPPLLPADGTTRRVARSSEPV